MWLITYFLPNLYKLLTKIYLKSLFISLHLFSNACLSSWFVIDFLCNGVKNNQGIISLTLLHDRKPWALKQNQEIKKSVDRIVGKDGIPVLKNQ